MLFDLSREKKSCKGCMTQKGYFFQYNVLIFYYTQVVDKVNIINLLVLLKDFYL